MARRLFGIILAAALAWVIGTGAVAGKGVIDRTYDPSPPDAAYETVWAETETTITLAYPDDLAVRLPAIVRFRDDDGHGATTVTAELHRVTPGVWRGRFALPAAGRWEGLHQYGPPFALRALPADDRPALGPPWTVFAAAAAAVGVLAAAARRSP